MWAADILGEFVSRQSQPQVKHSKPVSDTSLLSSDSFCIELLGNLDTAIISHPNRITLELSFPFFSLPYWIPFKKKSINCLNFFFLWAFSFSNLLSKKINYFIYDAEKVQLFLRIPVVLVLNITDQLFRSLQDKHGRFLEGKYQPEYLCTVLVTSGMKPRAEGPFCNGFFSWHVFSYIITSHWTLK